MGIQDANLTFCKQQAITGTSDVVSTDVYNAGSALKVFGGTAEKGVLAIQVTASGGTTPAMRARLVGADNAGLTTNPIVICETGVTPTIVAADLPILWELLPCNQTTAKQYYGVIFLQTGTSPTATVNAYYAEAAQNNLVK